MQDINALFLLMKDNYVVFSDVIRLVLNFKCIRFINKAF